MNNRNEDKQIYIRKWQYEDADALFTLGRDRRMKAYWEHSYPYTQRKAEDCIQFLIHANPHRYAIYAVVITDQLCGWIQAKAVEHQCAEITFWLHHYDQETAILKSMLNQLIPLAFAHLDILTLYMKIPMEEIPLRMALLQTGFIENNETVPIYLYFLHACTLEKANIRQLKMSLPLLNQRDDSNL